MRSVKPAASAGKALLGLLLVGLLQGPTAAPAAAAAPELSTVVVTGAGWGHGVGLSQYGGYGMALEGAGSTEIVEHYYTGATVLRLGTDLPAAPPLWVNLERNRSDVTLSVVDADVRVDHEGTSRVAAAGSSFRVTASGGGGCAVSITGPGGNEQWSGGCSIDLIRLGAGVLRIEGCTVSDWNAEPTTQAPCGYRFGVMHVRPASGGNSIHLALEIDLEEYLLGIAEVPYRWGDPDHGAAAALEAQVIAARSYAHHLQLRRGDPATSICDGWCHVRDTVWDQVYAGDEQGGPAKANWVAAVEATQGMVLTHPEGTAKPVGSDRGIVLAYYASSTGGRTEEQSEVWGGAQIPYLRSVDDHWSLQPANPFASWEVEVPAATVAQLLGVDGIIAARVLTRRTSGSAATVEFRAVDGGSAVIVTRSGSWVMQNFGLRSQYFDLGSDVSLPGERVGMHDPATGIWYLIDAEGSSSPFYYGNPADRPFTGDWDGDGVDTPGLYRTSTGFLFLRNRNTQGIADIAIYYGDPGDIPVAGDWDGDGVDTVGIYRPSMARFYLRNANSQGIADLTVTFGNPDDLPVAGDWDGDGIDTVGVYRRSVSRFYLRNSNTGGVADLVVTLGNPGDVPLAGDWDGDGVDSVGIYRPSQGRFYLLDSSDATVRTVDWGGFGMTPVAGAWD